MSRHSKAKKRRRQLNNSLTHLTPSVQPNTFSAKPKPKLTVFQKKKPLKKNKFLRKLNFIYLDGYPGSTSRNLSLDQQIKKLEKELNGIKTIYHHDLSACTPFQRARWLIYEGLLGLTETITIHDYFRGELLSKDTQARKQIQLGGQLLHQIGPMSHLHGMLDDLLWLFIPDAFHRTVEFLWDGIGDWKA